MWITRGMVVWSVLGLWIEKRVVCSVCGLVGEVEFCVCELKKGV